jgi:hypothetical protein
MAYKIKKKIGRKKATYKVRSAKGITPKGFTFKHYSTKKKAFIFKREK